MKRVEKWDQEYFRILDREREPKQNVTARLSGVPAEKDRDSETYFFGTDVVQTISYGSVVLHQVFKSFLKEVSTNENDHDRDKGDRSHRHEQL